MREREELTKLELLDNEREREELTKLELLDNERERGADKTRAVR